MTPPLPAPGSPGPGVSSAQGCGHPRFSPGSQLVVDAQRVQDEVDGGAGGFASLPSLDAKLLEGRDQVVFLSGEAGVSGSLEEGKGTKATAWGAREVLSPRSQGGSAEGQCWDGGATEERGRARRQWEARHTRWDFQMGVPRSRAGVRACSSLRRSWGESPGLGSQARTPLPTTKQGRVVGSSEDRGTPAGTCSGRRQDRLERSWQDQGV